MSIFNINLHETIFFLSDSLNLLGSKQIDHGKRVAYITAECGKALQWDDQQIDDLFLAAILHDCGISKTVVYERLVSFNGKNAGNHCVTGSELLSACLPLAYLSDCILHHHVDWEELKGIDLPDSVKLSANCIYMADTVDFLVLQYLDNDPNILANKETIRKHIASKRDSFFAAEIVDVFLELSKPEAFWLTLEKGHNSGYATAWMGHKQVVPTSFTDLKSIALLYARMVDAKSHYTKSHSEGVANLSRYLGELFGLTEHTCDKLELAGLLHDLGKLRVPDAILEKPGKLTDSEWFVMQRHSYDTYDIIKDIQGFEEISLWASQHHERIDGSGYPFRSSHDDLSLEARIIAVADVFQSLSQDRPYRMKIQPEELMHILQLQVQGNKIDKLVVEMVDDNLVECWEHVKACKPVDRVDSNELDIVK
ncbi:MAG: hypothetical protein methR_P3934 [Methyloprofundus sp.]|nr:MAG: hypothetical protein methR_P3934 [Methyloprofundus sp.]